MGKNNFSIDDLADIFSEDQDLVTFKETDDGQVLNWIPTLIPLFDYKLAGGIPVSGQISEIIGKPSTGKSTFSATIIKNGLNMNILPVYFDVEKTENWLRLEQLGVDSTKVKTLVAKKLRDGKVKPISVEDIGEKILQVLAMVHSKYPEATTLFIWDSIAQSQSEMDAEADMHQQTVGQQAKALNNIVRKLVSNLVTNNGGILAFNQARVDMNAAMPKYQQLKTTGGEGWEHALSTRISLKKSKKIYAKSADKEPIGNFTRVQVPKSKIGDNFGADFEVALFGAWGFDFEYNLILEAQEAGLIGKSSPKYISDNGEELSGRSIYELTNNLKKESSFDIKCELWQKVAFYFFPKAYPALFNTTAILYEDKFPIIKGMRKKYIDIQKALPYASQSDNYKLFIDYYKKHKLPEKLAKEFKDQEVELFEKKK